MTRCLIPVAFTVKEEAIDRDEVSDDNPLPEGWEQTWQQRNNAYYYYK